MIYVLSFILDHLYYSRTLHHFFVFCCHYDFIFVICAFNLNISEAETEKSLRVQDQSGLSSLFQDSHDCTERPYLKNIKYVK